LTSAYVEGECDGSEVHGHSS